jgi:hypothetical protein
MKPMLCSSVDLSAVDELIESTDWYGQQKLDGDRLLIHVKDGEVRALNREGEIRRNMVPAKVLREFAFDGEWYFDGELMDDGTLWLFDLPFANGHVTGEHPLSFRVEVLERLFASWQPSPCIRLLTTVRHASAKRELFCHLRHALFEGMVFKRADGLYRSGKRSQSMLKAKFTSTVDAVVTAVRPEGRENCLLGLFDNGTMVPIGSVSLVGRPAVSPGDVVEVRYLYAGTNRSLVQPVMLRRRHDKSAAECTVDQLVFTDRSVVEVERKFTFRAVNRRGTNVTGTFSEDPGEFARVRYGRRWQSMVILDEGGDHVGGIQPHPDTGKRIWWG